MKINLINLPADRFLFTTPGVLPPLGLAYIASVLINDGHKVKIMDIPAGNISEHSFRASLVNDDSDIYGISSTLFGLKEALKYSAIIKKIKPDKRIVLGGLCTVLPAEVILRNAAEIDIVVTGEGEAAMRKLAGAAHGLSSIEGISYRLNGRIAGNPAAAPLSLDGLPPAARHLLPNKRYRLHPPFGLYSPVTSMETSRGCPYRCRFCCLSHSYRYRKAGSVADEIQYLARAYAIKEIYFVDHTFTVSEERTYRLCEEILRRKLKIRWTCKTRVDCVSSGLLKIMKKAGCYMISYGVESGSQEILDKLKKDITTLQIEDAFRWTRQAGIRSIAYLLIGSPEENKKSIMATIKLAGKIKPDYVLYGALAIDPASELYPEALAKGMIGQDYFEKLLFSQGASDWPLYATADLPRNEITGYVRMATRRFYLRPSYWAGRLRKIRTPRELAVMFKGLAFLLSDLFVQKKRKVVKY